MKKIFLLTSILLIAIVFCSCNKKQLTDKEILKKIYNANNGENWEERHRENWLSEKPLAEWKGVETDSAGRVVSLELWSDSLSGAIPAEIEGLTELEKLGLSLRNYKEDVPNPLPAGIGNLTKLKELTLKVRTGRDFTYPVLPDLSALVNLEKLQLHGFVTPIPTYIGKFSNLKDIEIYDFKGAIPAEICNLTNLERIFFRTGSQPESAVPANIGKLTKLKQLMIDYNTGFAGGIKAPNAPFPESVWDLENVQHLFLRSVSNAGNQIPADKVAKMTKLRSVTLTDCGITGTIPVEFFKHPDIYDFSIYKNNLTGEIPKEIGNCLKISTLNLSRNQLSGPIPASIGNLEDLSILWLENNKLTGAVPAELAKCKKLNTFDVSGNQLSPNIPAALQAHPEFKDFKF